MTDKPMSRSKRMKTLQRELKQCDAEWELARATASAAEADAFRKRFNACEDGFNKLSMEYAVIMERWIKVAVGSFVVAMLAMLALVALEHFR